MIHSDLTKLKDEIREKAISALTEMRSDSILKELGVDGIIVSETLRELSVQMAYFSRSRMGIPEVQAMYKAAGLYAIGDAEARRAATWTLSSKHLEGKAIDIVPTREDKPWWTAPVEVWGRMGTIGKAHGLSWGGDWKNRDCPHFEIGD